MAFFPARIVFIACTFCSFIAQVFAVSFNVSLFLVQSKEEAMETDATTEAKKEEGAKEGEKKEEVKEKTEDAEKDKEEKKEEKAEEEKKVGDDLNVGTNALSLSVRKVHCFFQVCCVSVCFDICLVPLAVRSVSDYDANMQDSTGR